MEKKLSERLRDAYMIGDKELIDSVLNEVKEKRETLQKKTNVTPITINTVLNNNGSAIKVYEFLNEIFGEDWWELEFETIERILWIRYGTALDDNMRDKIWGIKHLCFSNRAFLDFFEFNQLCLSLSGVIASFEVLIAPTVGMIINTVNAMKIIRPEEVFSREVKKYISIILINNGIYVPPISLKEIIEDEFEVLLNTFNKEDWTNIYNKYKEILESKKFELGEDMIDIQTRRLLNAEMAALEYSK
jgi:hypothetical protein